MLRAGPSDENCGFQRSKLAADAAETAAELHHKPPWFLTGASDEGGAEEVFVEECSI